MYLAEVFLMDDFHYTQTDLPLPGINRGTSLLVHKVHPDRHFVLPFFFLLYIFLSIIPLFYMKDHIDKPVASIVVS